MATLQLTFEDLYNRVAKFLGTYGSSGPSGANLTDAQDIVNDAYTQFITAHDWTFLKPSQQLTTITGQHIYGLPDDFYHMLTDLQFGAGTSYPPVQEVSVDAVMEMRSIETVSSWPTYYAIRPTAYDKEVGQSWEILFYPTCDAAYTLNFRYRILTDKLENADDIPIGGAEHTQLLRQMSLAEAELQKEKTIGPQGQQAANQLQGAVNQDSKRNPHRLGYNGNGIANDPWDIARGSFRVSDVNYNTD